jgi:hypothetical protein
MLDFPLLYIMIMRLVKLKRLPCDVPIMWRDTWDVRVAAIAPVARSIGKDD